MLNEQSVYNNSKNKFPSFLSKITYSKLGISDNKIIHHLPIEGREVYMKYHRKEIFQGNIEDLI